MRPSGPPAAGCPGALPSGCLFRVSAALSTSSFLDATPAPGHCPTCQRGLCLQCPRRGHLDWVTGKGWGLRRGAGSAAGPRGRRGTRFPWLGPCGVHRGRGHTSPWRTGRTVSPEQSPPNSEVTRPLCLRTKAEPAGLRGSWGVRRRGGDGHPLTLHVAGTAAEPGCTRWLGEPRGGSHGSAAWPLLPSWTRQSTAAVVWWFGGVGLCSGLWWLLCLSGRRPLEWRLTHVYTHIYSHTMHVRARAHIGGLCHSGSTWLRGCRAWCHVVGGRGVLVSREKAAATGLPFLKPHVKADV